MKMNGTRIRVLDFSKRFLARRYLPAILAIGAILVMLPALKTGLFMDDLVQRAVELRPDQLPARLRDTGIPADSGSLRAVLRDLFPGVATNPQSVAQTKKYGLLPWWSADDMKLGLWRPFSAFSHWLDYRLFPDSPVLMHAHSIAWFAAVVFLVTIVYRKLGVVSGSRLASISLHSATARQALAPPNWAAGLAALLFLLDTNLYFPVLFVANRGFVMSLFFGLLCLYQHHQWRSANSRSGCVLSALSLALALFANEGGASTLAFIFAYALVLESGSVGKRALSVLPAVLVVVLWRAIYKLGGFGLYHVGLYIDPATEPLAFAPVVFPRAIAMLGAQFTGVAPDFLMAMKPSAYPTVIEFYGLAAAAALMVFVPCVCRDKIAAFWLAVTLLAVIPAATVAPLSKNLGFVAVGAFGLMARFIAALVARPNGLPDRLAYRIPAWVACIVLLIMHVPVAIAGRILTVHTLNTAPKGIRNFVKVDRSPDIEDKNVVVVNAPSAFMLAYSPFYRAYYGEPLPRTMRTLAPGCTGLEVRRTDDKTLVIQSAGQNIFACDDVGSIHAAYLLNIGNVVIGGPVAKKGDRHELGGLTVEVLESDADDVASTVSFRFDTPLESPDFHWLWWDWRTLSYKPFTLPSVGQSVTLSGPSRRADSEGRKLKNE